MTITDSVKQIGCSRDWSIKSGKDGTILVIVDNKNAYSAGDFPEALDILAGMLIEKLKGAEYGVKCFLDSLKHSTAENRTIILDGLQPAMATPTAKEKDYKIQFLGFEKDDQTRTLLCRDSFELGISRGKVMTELHGARLVKSFTMSEMDAAQKWQKGMI